MWCVLEGRSLSAYVCLHVLYMCISLCVSAHKFMLYYFPSFTVYMHVLGGSVKLVCMSGCPL